MDPCDVADIRAYGADAISVYTKIPKGAIFQVEGVADKTATSQ